MANGRLEMLLRDFTFLLCILICNTFQTVSAEIYLEKLDSLYLPYSYSPVALYGFNQGAAEQSAYDSDRHLVFSVGGDTIHVIDVSSPNNLRPLTHYTVGDGAEMTDVEVCREFVFTGIHNETDPENGRLNIFQYDNETNTFDLLHSVIVGPRPDMILPTKDCNTVFVALEAVGYVVNDVIIDPEGGLGIFRWDSRISSANLTYRILDFKKFNTRTDKLVEKGVRFIYRENNNTLSRDLEPEYIALNDEETMAYVCLQENSAIAVVNLTDLDTAEVIDIYPLGIKSWINYTMDTSDKDGESAMRKWPVYGLLQPDAISYFSHGGENYIVTANEGDSKEYFGSNGQVLFSEERRGKDLITENLVGDNIDEITRGYLDDKTQLGRLKFQLAGHFQNGSRLDNLYSYGGRSLSVVRTSDMKVVYDSGDIVEKSILQKYPALHNCNSNEGLLLSECTDQRSDDKGPECESVSVGKLWGKTVIFLGNERPGTISVFSKDDKSFEPRFESVNFGGLLQDGRTWGEMYERRTSGDLDPEDIKFISEDKSPNGEPLLLVTAAVSGTISMYAVRVSDMYTSTESLPDGSTEAVLCADDELKCRNTNRCVPLTLKCDGVNDCGDNTDEAVCSTSLPEMTDEVYRGLVIAVVCLISVCLLFLIGLCFLHHKRSGQTAYEMKTRM